MSDDEIIGLKSTSIKFKNNINMFVSFAYLVFIVLNILLFREFYGQNIFTFFQLLFILSLVYQLIQLKNGKSKNYLKLFKLNNYTGLILFLSICALNL